MSTLTKLTLAFIFITQLAGCSIRMFNIGDENSVTDRVDSLGYYDNDYRKRNQAEEVTIEDFTKGKDN